MVQYTTTILKYEAPGDKSGWTYVIIPSDIAEALNPGVRRGYRVKGRLDDHPVKAVAIFPMGNGSFMLPLNAAMRKSIHKKKGAMLKLRLELDKTPIKICAELLECLADEPVANANFKKIPLSQQNYYSKWIESAKTEPTRTKRIAQAVSSLARGIIDYGEMIRSFRTEKNDL